MQWFGRKAARASARPSLTRGFAPVTAAGQWPRGYEAQVRDGYLANPVAQRAVRLVCESLGQTPIAASDPAMLRLLTAQSGGQGLLETVAAHLMLNGNGFVRLLTDPGGALTELFALRPERVAVEADARGWPSTYLYRVGEICERFDAAGPRPQIVHLKGFHPLDDHLGLGCLGAAAGAIAIHNAATRWNKALLDNAARPSGALVADGPAPLSADQFDRLRGELETQFQGAGNAGRPLLLEGGLRWQAMSLSPADMDFVGLKAAAAREIALAFGVPPMLLGLPGDATYANYREANRALWRLTILPLATKILAGLTQALGGWWPDPVLRVELDRIPELAEDRERVWAMASQADFLTAEEKRRVVGL